MDPHPLGDYVPRAPLLMAALIAAAASLIAALLFELSRTLSIVARGRWYAGNGRDLFHVLAGLVVFAGLFAMGLPPALCGIGSAFACAGPLLVLDQLPPERGVRLLILLGLCAIGLLPPLLEPHSISDFANLIARAAFPAR